MAPLTALGTGAAGLATRGARQALVFVWFCGLANGVLVGFFSPPSPSLLWAYTLALVGAIVLTHPEDDLLRGVRAFALPAISVTIVILVISVDVTPRQIWLVDFSGYLLALFVARGNLLPGYIGAASQLFVLLVWGIATQQEPRAMTEMMALSFMSYVLSVIWRLVLRSAVKQERAHRTAVAESARHIAAAAVASMSFQREIARVREQATPALQDLRDGRPLDDVALTTYRVLEGRIRDRLRSPGLQHPLIDDAVAQARARGTNVLLLADSAAGEMIADAAAADVAAALASETATRIVISTLASRPDRINIVVEGDGVLKRISVPR